MVAVRRPRWHTRHVIISRYCLLWVLHMVGGVSGDEETLVSPREIDASVCPRARRTHAVWSMRQCSGGGRLEANAENGTPMASGLIFFRPPLRRCLYVNRWQRHEYCVADAAMAVDWSVYSMKGRLDRRPMASRSAIRLIGMLESLSMGHPLVVV